ncbi:hypothetical protein EDB92DRAFT_1054032 [Lactarius akahatsu]|uniref:Uncharacterized protein n=1 Tax=Lactarius akahatsu TaxID=416441 RepID=A0AAD4LBZ3_9AGAM|nr:hypothetical protein EDB92DRAFT_1054032 [Lactarius akahatsu]
MTYLFRLSYSVRNFGRNRCIICLSPLHVYTFHSFLFLSVFMFLPALPSVRLSDLSNIYLSHIARNKYVKHKPHYYAMQLYHKQKYSRHYAMTSLFRYTWLCHAIRRHLSSRPRQTSICCIIRVYPAHCCLLFNTCFCFPTLPPWTIQLVGALRRLCISSVTSASGFSEVSAIGVFSIKSGSNQYRTFHNASLTKPR